ncbi:MAG: hypothetical protein U9N34_06250 [Candidatus Cloacimonadota bacterium]|nr:hypothetical protein [Candidatus Cloacimonadota bacterium]
MSEQEKNEKVEEVQESGFFMGLLHGAIAPYKLFGVLFGAKVNFFKTKNISVKYTLGAFLGLVGSTAKFVSTSNSKKKNKK